MFTAGITPESMAPASLLTPHLGRPFAFLIDRAATAEPSFAGSGPSEVLIVERGGACRVLTADAERRPTGDPIDVIAEFIERRQRTPCSLPLWLSPDAPLPRTVGFLSYELGGCIEAVPVAATDPVGAPLAVLATYPAVHAWHPATGRVAAVVFDEAITTPPRPLEHHGGGGSPDESDVRKQYEEAFARIQRAITAGDIYQANLSRRIVIAGRIDAAQAYLRLRERQPVPHGAYFDMGAWKLLSNSPECYLRVDGEVVRTFPIKGTRPRCGDRAKDRSLARELARDAKERAEHLMIVDLERNDLGRVCRTGSVTVPAFADVASFATVHHLVSEVRGCLRDDVRLAELLRATFPGGSITGAPKIRAMEIIAEVEQTARGVYTGAIGFFNGPRSLELSIAIRTAIATADAVHYSTGGGIVADSRLADEWQETVAKARAFMDTIGTPALDRHVVGG